MLCLDTELNSETICFNGCLIEWHIIEGCGHIFSDTKCHDALIALCSILLSTITILYKSICWIVRTFHTQSISIVRDGLVRIRVTSARHIHVKHKLGRNRINIEKRSQNLEMGWLWQFTRCHHIQLKSNRAINDSICNSLGICVGLVSECRDILLILCGAILELHNGSFDCRWWWRINCKVHWNGLVTLHLSDFFLRIPSCYAYRGSIVCIHYHNSGMEIITYHARCNIHTVNTKRISTMRKNLTDTILRIDWNTMWIGVRYCCSSEGLPFVFDVNLNGA